MIQYSLTCEARHTFDAWFRNAAAYEDQAARGLLVCPVCNSHTVEKALMAPAVTRTPEKVALSAGHPDHAKLIAAMRALKNKITSEADYVGEKFAEEARKMHYGESEQRSIYGETTFDEAKELRDEGIEIQPLPRLPRENA